MTRIVRTTASALILRSRPQAVDTTDTGARLIKGQAAASLGQTWEKDWEFLVAPAGDGWASSKFLEVVPPTVPAVPPPRINRWPRVPSGYNQIVELFGQPCNKALCDAGRVKMPAPLPLSWNKTTSIRIFSCHELIEPVLTSVFNEIHTRGYWHLLEDFGGCYNCREQRGTTSKVSTHSWGIGLDLNANQNPLGKPPKMPPQIIAIFKDHGFQWGGTWQRPDGMHFQYATNY